MKNIIPSDQSQALKKELKEHFQNRRLDSLTLSQRLYRQNFKSEASQLSRCSEYMLYAYEEHIQTQEKRTKLKHGSFCKFRFCPMCLWRRRLKYTQNILQKLDTLPENLVYRHLVLTVQNPSADQLKNTIQRMNKAFRNFYRYSLKGAVGAVKAIEILGKKTAPGDVHPHFHVLLISKKSNQYFQSQKELQDLWERAYKEKPAIVHIRKIRANEFFDKKIAALLEVVKYATKTQSLMNRSDIAFSEIIRQTYMMRFIATFGCLYKVDLSDSNLELKKDDNEWREIAQIMAKWDTNHYTIKIV